MSVTKFVHSVESLLPSNVVAYYREKKLQLQLRKAFTGYARTIRGIQAKKGPINVLFFALDSNTWKYDSVIQAMQQDIVFSPLVLVVPQVNKGRDFMLSQLRHGMEYYQSKGYAALCSYDEKSDAYVNALSLHPDIIFFSNPYDGLVDDRYNIRHYFGKVLTCYVNYNYCNVPYQWDCASPFHQKVWKYYVECESNYNQIKQFCSAYNCVVTGYPTSDLFASTVETGKDWKMKDSKLKRIIWAPHHTIEGNTGMTQFSTFSLYYDFMLRIAEEYKDSVQFVFKPHPLLQSALYKHKDWGKERTDAYYERWANGDNTAFVNGDYVDLFKSSDAMIHDCGSFTIEYLNVKKPVMFLDSYDRKSQCNEVAIKAYNCHYIGKNEGDIRDFLERVVIGGSDIFRENRNSFYDEFLLPPNGMTVAENIINNLKSALG